MVYEIKPRADHLNRMIDLGYRRRAGQRSWMDYVLKKEPVAEESAPVLILSERPSPLPDAFEISSDFWCVSGPMRDLMQRLFGSQVAFFEVPVTAKQNNASQPSTNFVTFSQFCNFIDWQKSKVQSRMSSRSGSDTGIISLADALDAAAFKVMSRDEEMIWIERSFREGNRLFSPRFSIYVTDAAAQVIEQAFPGAFILEKQRGDPGSTAPSSL